MDLKTRRQFLSFGASSVSMPCSRTSARDLNRQELISCSIRSTPPMPMQDLCLVRQGLLPKLDASTVLRKADNLAFFVINTMTSRLAWTSLVTHLRYSNRPPPAQEIFRFSLDSPRPYRSLRAPLQSSSSVEDERQCCFPLMQRCTLCITLRLI